MLHPLSPNANSLYNHGAFVKIRKLLRFDIIGRLYSEFATPFSILASNPGYHGAFSPHVSSFDPHDNFSSLSFHDIERLGE